MTRAETAREFVEKGWQIRYRGGNAVCSTPSDLDLIVADERDEFLRAAWRLVVAGEIDAERLVFVDEMGTNVSLSSLYAWSRKGERALGSAPRNWGKNVTLLASITREGLGPCLAVEGSTTREVFGAYLGRVLAPTLEPGQR